MLAGTDSRGRHCCIACGGREGGCSNHHCDPKKIARIEAARQAAGEREGWNRSYGSRLAAGFGLLAMAGDR